MTTTATLMAMAYRVEKGLARCEVCGGDARYSQRLTSEGQPASWHEEVIKVGDKDIYQPRCGECHVVAGEHVPWSVEVGDVVQPSQPPLSTVSMEERLRSGAPRP